MKPVLKRQLYQALHKFERRQAALRGAVLMPQVMDLEVSGMPEETGR